MAQTPPPGIDPAPAPAPQRGDRATFSGRVDAFVTWLIAAVTQFYNLGVNVYNNAVDAYQSALTATAQATAAVAAVNAPKWISGTTYAIGDVRWSPTNGQTYRRLTAGAGTTDPSADATNWAAVVGNLILIAGKNASYTAVKADKGANLAFPSGSFTLNLPASLGIGNGWYIYANNYGSTGVVNVLPNGAEFINGETSFLLLPKCWVLLVSNGSNFEILGSGLKTPDRFSPGSIASAATINLDNMNGDAVHITSSGAISSLVLAAGIKKTLVFDGASTLVNSATLPTPTGTDMTLAAGSVVQVIGDAGGVTRVVGVGRTNTGFLHAQDQKASNSSPATISGGTSTARNVAVTVANSIAGASVATTQITLPAGTYDLEATAPGISLTTHRAQWYNVTDGAAAVTGPGAYGNTGENTVTNAAVEGRFTITSTKVFELRHYAAGSGPGGAAVAQPGVIEIYAEVRLWKVS